MKVILKKMVVLTFFMSFILAFSSCSNGSGDESSDEKVNLKVGESYSFTELPSYKVPDTWSFNSSNSDVADIMGRTCILARAEGNAKVTVNMVNQTRVFNVTVTKKSSDDTRWFDAQEVKDTYGYLGCGYNALKATTLPTFENVISNSIIPVGELSNVIKDAIQSGKTGVVSQDSSSSDAFVEVSGESAEQFSKNYTEKIGGQLKINLPTISVSGKVRGDFKNEEETHENTQMIFATVTSYNIRFRYNLLLSPAEIRQLAKKNEAAYKELIGSMQPAELFEKYGTHYITGSNFGGRMDFDYVLTATDTNTKKSDLLEIAGGINAKIAAVKVNAEGNFSKTEDSKIETKKSHVTTTFKGYGGSHEKSALIGIDNFREAYIEWYRSLNKSNIVMIGIPNENYVVGIWELIDVDNGTAEEKAKAVERRNQLKTAYETLLKQESTKK